MPEPIPRSLFLTGFMGAGKSSVGPLLARALALPFFDLDRDIEEAAGMTIPEVFQLRGETGFREIEAARLVARCAVPAVVALGGGALIRPDNRNLLSRHGILVYLKTDLVTCFARANPSSRPLLQGHLTPDAEILALFARREPGYLTAEITVVTDGQSIAETVAAILKEYSQCTR